jgi:AbiV family abortive infection protein
MYEHQETQSVTAPYLLEGAVYALEQGGLLLHDANLLYRNGSFATAVAVATFAREELGRWQILLRLRKKVLGGMPLLRKGVRARCKRHEDKLGAGWLTFMLRGPLIEELANADSGSNEWKAAKKEVDRLAARKKKRVPDERHLKRMSALYVDPNSVTEWNRPAKKITREFAFSFLMDVGNEYWLEQAHGYSDLASVATKDAELAEALENWTDRPTMPAREAIFP